MKSKAVMALRELGMLLGVPVAVSIAGARHAASICEAYKLFASERFLGAWISDIGIHLNV